MAYIMANCTDKEIRTVTYLKEMSQHLLWKDTEKPGWPVSLLRCESAPLQ
jgi:hypothetical protein